MYTFNVLCVLHVCVCVCMREQRRQIKKVRAHRLPRVRCTDPMGLVEVRANWPGHPRLSKKKKVRAHRYSGRRIR